MLVGACVQCKSGAVLFPNSQNFIFRTIYYAYLSSPVVVIVVDGGGVVRGPVAIAVVFVVAVPVAVVVVRRGPPAHA